MSLDSASGAAVNLNLVMMEVNQNYTTPEAFIATYQRSMSKYMSPPLIVHTVSERADYGHRRVTSVITRLPKVALWLLVVANSTFAILDLVIAIIAIHAASPTTHQAQIRLSTIWTCRATFRLATRPLRSRERC